ncbi:hypothetical protein ACFY9G_35985 [Streptomyces anthocyanicus]|uniref:DUF8175 domain-containing protein n=1 Tax=Streptomyces violaceolatus TaxID=67378 RepID=A0ABN3TAK3_9ACTN|nr:MULTISPECIES: hypothetical protein [Streptomyces]MDX3348597.1 hypothetical protein [Streptomyces sp. ME02-6979A]
MSAGFLAITLTVGGIVALTTGGGETSAPAATDLPDLGRGDRPEGCRTDDSGEAVPMAPPKGIKWRMLGLVRVPVSAEAGPTRMDGGVWWCFAHTPLGAVMAAHIITSEVTEKHWRSVVDRQIVAGQGRDIFKFTRAIEPDIIRGSASNSVATPAGFTVTSYTDSAAEVKLLLRTSSGYAGSTFDLRWSGGDWRLLPSSDGALHSDVTPMENPRGYVLWKG